MSRDEIVRAAIESLYDAADDDSATGGPDLTRRLFPMVLLSTAEGTSRVPDDEIGTVTEAIVAARTANPGA
jgi:proteasome beta subunit